MTQSVVWHIYHHYCVLFCFSPIEVSHPSPAPRSRRCSWVRTRLRTRRSPRLRAAVRPSSAAGCARVSSQWREKSISTWSSVACAMRPRYVPNSPPQEKHMRLTGFIENNVKSINPSWLRLSPS